MERAVRFAPLLALLIVAFLRWGLQIQVSMFTALVASGRYDDIDSAITEKNFPIVIPDDLEDIEGHLLNFGSIKIQDAATRLRKEGFQPATFTLLLLFNSLYPNPQRYYRTIALGSLTTLPGGMHAVQLDWRDGVHRDLTLTWVGASCESDCAFLAVKVPPPQMRSGKTI